MKLRKSLRIFIPVLLIVLCFAAACENNLLFNFNNPVDPLAESYTGENIIVSNTNAIVVVSPVDVAATGTPELVLAECADGIQYKFQVSTSSESFEDNIIWQLESDDWTVFPDYDWSDGTVYYWRGAALNEAGEWGVYSSIGIFTAASDISGMSPVNQSSTIDTTPLFDWDDVIDSDGYELRYAMSPGGLAAASEIALTASNYQLPLSDVFSFDDVVYWQVRPVIGTTAGVWSPVSSFTVNINISWSGISPSDGGTTHSASPTLSWNNVSGAAGYEVRYASDTVGLDSATAQAVTVSEFDYPGTLTDAEQVYWQLRAKNEDDQFSEWSTPPFEFTYEEQAATADGLVGEYLFIGNANDTSVNSNHGTVEGATLTTDRFGNAESAYYFDGSNDRIGVPVGALSSLGSDVTFTMWVKHPAEPIEPVGNAAHFMLDTDPVKFRMTIAGADPYQPSFDRYPPSGGYARPFGSIIPSEEWVFLAFVLEDNADRLTIYVNDTSAEAAYIEEYSDGNPTGAYIGYSIQQGGGWFKGAIDDLRIYNKALSAAEVNANYIENGF